MKVSFCLLGPIPLVIALTEFVISSSTACEGLDLHASMCFCLAIVKYWSGVRYCPAIKHAAVALTSSTLSGSGGKFQCSANLHQVFHFASLGRLLEAAYLFVSTNSSIFCLSSLLCVSSIAADVDALCACFNVGKSCRLVIVFVVVAIGLVMTSCLLIWNVDGSAG